MTPIFHEFKQMLFENGVDLSQYDDNKLWIDRLIVFGMNRFGHKKQICRIEINDDLNYNYTFYPQYPKNNELITWYDAYDSYEKYIVQRERESISVIRRVVHNHRKGIPVLCTSMGKDSKLVQYLLDKAGVGYRTIFNNTTMDCAEVYREAKTTPGVEIVTLKDKTGLSLKFYEMAKEFGPPNQNYRWCCSYFKEGATEQYLDGQDNILFFMGMRKEESNTRANYGFERKDSRWKNKTWLMCLPIVNWTETHLWLYTLHNGIAINEKYRRGYGRVGCNIACPYYTRYTWSLDRYWYPNAFERWREILRNDFIDNNKWTIMNCTLREYDMCWKGGPLRDKPTTEVVNEFMKYSGITDFALAKQFFNKRCSICGASVIKKDEIAMNLKASGTYTKEFKCKEHLCEEMSWSESDWKRFSAFWKESGCELF